MQIHNFCLFLYFIMNQIYQDTFPMFNGDAAVL